MEQPQCAGSVIQIGTIQCPADRIAEGACALGRDDVNGHMLGLRHLHHRPRWRGDDLERGGYPRTGAPGRVGDDDDPRKNILRQYRTQCRPEETHILLNGDHSRNAGIHILPMRIWSRRHGVGQRLMNIAITCRTHKLPVYAPDLKGVCGATPAPGALAYIDGVRARSCHPKYRIAHHGRWPISGIAHALRILRTHVWHHGRAPLFRKNASGSVCAHNALCCQDTSPSGRNSPHNSCHGSSAESSTTPHMRFSLPIELFIRTKLHTCNFGFVKFFLVSLHHFYGTVCYGVNAMP